MKLSYINNYRHLSSYYFKYFFDVGSMQSHQPKQKYSIMVRLASQRQGCTRPCPDWGLGY